MKFRKEYRDCIKSRRQDCDHKAHQALYVVQLLNEEGDRHILYCIMICLVIKILSLLLFIQSLYSLSKLIYLLTLSLVMLIGSTIHLMQVITTYSTYVHHSAGADELVNFAWK